MFSPQVTTATSPATVTSTSVSTNWMYDVLAMIIDQDRSTVVAAVQRRPARGARS